MTYAQSSRVAREAAKQAYDLETQQAPQKQAAHNTTKEVMATNSLSVEAYQRKIAADRELRQPDKPGQRNSAAREYKRELARHMRNEGHGAAKETTDRKIASKLLAQKYDKAEIRDAIQKHSPTAVRPSQVDSRHYADSVMGRANPNIRAAAKLSNLSPEQTARVNRMKATQEHYIRTGGKGKYSEGQQFRVKVANEIDREGLNKAMKGSEADIKAAQYAIQKGSNPNSKKFHKTIGRCSGTPIVHHTKAGQQDYGKQVAAIAHKRNLDDQPNQRPERSQSKEIHHRAPTSQNAVKGTTKSGIEAENQKKAAYYHHHQNHSR